MPSGTMEFELEVTEGLEHLASAEVAGRLGVSAATIDQGTGWLRFASVRPFRQWPTLRLAESAFQVETFEVPRPKSLLGDQHFRRLVSTIQRVSSGYPEPPQTLSVAAAGSDSSVMCRLREELARATGLNDAGREGDVQIRLFRARADGGWDTLIRLTPRPLSTRAWRVCSFPGALNATVASAMAQLTLPRPNDRFVNLLSGSGTILIERLSLGSAYMAGGIDLNYERLACTAKNVLAAGLGGRVALLNGDGRQTPFRVGTIDALCADLPFGQRVGRHAENLALYPDILAEAARIARLGARFVVLTHEVALTERAIRENHDWHLLQSLTLNLRGLHPRIYVLERV